MGREDEFILLLQYLNGTSDTGVDLDFSTYYILLNFRVDDRQKHFSAFMTVWNRMLEILVQAEALTFAYNRRLSDNSYLQFEYLSPGRRETLVEHLLTTSMMILIQIRYKVFFLGIMHNP